MCESDDLVYFKYYRAPDDPNSGRFLAFESNPEAHLLDDCAGMIVDYPVESPYKSYGPQQN